MKFYRSFLLFVVAFAPVLFSSAQTGYSNASLSTPVKVAIFTPMYLSDAFDGADYKLGKSNLPKGILPGLEFYNGIMLAIDSLRNEGLNAELSIYDSKQDAMGLDRLFRDTALQGVGLMIAAITSPSELKFFANQALRKGIPFISATYPNYVGITQNPNFVLLNSSFGTHIEGLYSYMRRNYSASEVIAIKKPGATEDYIKNTITELNSSNTRIPLKIKWINVNEEFAATDITRYLDSTKTNVVFVASPLESFGVKVVKALATKSVYNVTAIGMPTWDAIKEFSSRNYKNVELIYTTPFSYSSNQILNSEIVSTYKSKYSSRPSDMVFKGFETTFHFTKLLAKHGQKLAANLSDKDFTLFNNFDIQPVKLRKTNTAPDFMENKKLYVVKKRGGAVMSIY